MLTGACSGGAAARVREAPDLVREAGSAQVEITMARRAPGAEGEEPIESTGVARGVIDFEAEQGRTVTEVELPRSVVEDLNVTLRPCESLIDGTDVYLRVVEERTDEFDGKPWVKVSGSAVAGFDVQAFGAADPSASLDLLRGVDDVEEVGTETIEGVRTERYHAVVDVDTLLERLDEDARNAFSQQIAPEAVQRIPLDVWLDEDGLPRRLHASFTMGDGQRATQATIDMTLGAFGDPVDVDFPAPDQVHESETATAAAAACFGAPG